MPSDTRVYVCWSQSAISENADKLQVNEIYIEPTGLPFLDQPTHC